MGVDTQACRRLYPLHTDGNATRRRRDNASLEKRLFNPNHFRDVTKVVFEASLFDKCRQKEKRGRRCSCGLTFGSVTDETLAVLRFRAHYLIAQAIDVNSVKYAVTSHYQISPT
jgi:hypothetical protein